MGVQSEIARIKANIQRAYEVLEAMGATMPNVLNSENLAPTIESLISSLTATYDNGKLTISGVSTKYDSGKLTISGADATYDNGKLTIS